MKSDRKEKQRTLNRRKKSRREMQIRVAFGWSPKRQDMEDDGRLSLDSSHKLSSLKYCCVLIC